MHCTARHAALAVLAATAVAAGSGLPALADAATIAQAQPTMFILKNGVLTAQPIIIAAAPVQATGNVNLVINVTLAPSIPATQAVTCSVSLSSYDASYDNTDTVSAMLVRSVSNSHAGTCTLKIQYKWTLAAAGETMVAATSLETGTYGSSTGVYRQSTHTFAAFAIPSGNTTKSLTLVDSL